MSIAVATNIHQIAMNTNFLTLKTERGEVELYLKDLMSTPVDSKDAYVNFTRICKIYKKLPNEYTRKPSTEEYAKRVKQIFNIQIPLIKSIAGRYGESFIHYKLLFHALRWVDMDLSIEMDMILEQVFRQADIIKVDRNETIDRFHPLTDAIKEFIAPHLEPNDRKFIYPTIMDFANLCTIGLTSRQYKAKHNLSSDYHIRQNFTEEQLNQVISIEKKFYDIITLFKLKNYHQLKALYLDRVSIINVLTMTKDELKTLNAKIDRWEREQRLNPTDKRADKIKAFIESFK